MMDEAMNFADQKGPNLIEGIIDRVRAFFCERSTAALFRTRESGCGH
jgi:hypothetical protein